MLALAAIAVQAQASAIVGDGCHLPQPSSMTAKNKPASLPAFQ